MSQTPDFIAAHPHSFKHRKELEDSSICGCFYCLRTFPPGEVTEWVDWPEDTPDGLELTAGLTALCPWCGIDSVIGSRSGYPINEEFLAFMNRHWFG